jgi:hypothetical protein
LGGVRFNFVELGLDPGVDGAARGFKDESAPAHRRVGIHLDPRFPALQPLTHPGREVGVNPDAMDFLAVQPLGAGLHHSRQRVGIDAHLAVQDPPRDGQRQFDEIALGLFSDAGAQGGEPLDGAGELFELGLPSGAGFFFGGGAALPQAALIGLLGAALRILLEFAERLLKASVLAGRLPPGRGRAEVQREAVVFAGHRRRSFVPCDRTKSRGPLAAHDLTRHTALLPPRAG